MVKKKENYLNFPYVLKTFEALDCCFISEVLIAILHTPNIIHFVDVSNTIQKEEKKQVLKLN